jgi:quinol monooxygenase YgiN
MRQVMVRYRVKPERVDENEELVRAVYAELHQRDKGGLRYVTFRLEDGVTFVHVAREEDSDRRESLTGLPAFKKFIENIADRCDEPPDLSELREIGSYPTLT